MNILPSLISSDYQRMTIRRPEIICTKNLLHILINKFIYGKNGFAEIYMKFYLNHQNM